MLITFRSKVGDITMFGDVATRLLKLMGQSGEVPGALLAADIPPAVARLKEALGQHRETDTASKPAKDDRDAEPPIALATRAKPLIDLLERAAKAGAEVIWKS
jgi:hypothetical protein